MRVWATGKTWDTFVILYRPLTEQELLERRELARLRQLARVAQEEQQQNDTITEQTITENESGQSEKNSTP